MDPRSLGSANGSMHSYGKENQPASISRNIRGRRIKKSLIEFYGLRLPANVITPRDEGWEHSQSWGPGDHPLAAGGMLFSARMLTPLPMHMTTAPAMINPSRGSL